MHTFTYIIISKYIQIYPNISLSICRNIYKVFSTSQRNKICIKKQKTQRFLNMFLRRPSSPEKKINMKKMKTWPNLGNQETSLGNLGPLGNLAALKKNLGPSLFFHGEVQKSGKVPIYN
jgi:hypothetical protein